MATNKIVSAAATGGAAGLGFFAGGPLGAIAGVLAVEGLKNASTKVATAVAEHSEQVPAQEAKYYAPAQDNVA